MIGQFVEGSDSPEHTRTDGTVICEATMACIIVRKPGAFFTALTQRAKMAC